MTGRCRACAVLVAAAILTMWPPPARGQGRRPPREPRLEISAGALFAGGYSLGSTEANLIANQTGGPTYNLFKSATRVGSAPGAEARVGFRLSRRFVVEGGVLTSRPEMTVRLTGDVEGAPDTTATERLSAYIIDAALVTTFGASRTGNLVPFVRVGAGYLRELHDDNMLVETGTAYHAGGGVTVWLGNRQRVGVRADARVYVIDGGIDFDNGTRTQGAGGAGVVFVF